ncbi:hypothetical protein ACFL3D_00255 [Candidatus Omnitrophota bacterium]
MGVHFLVIAIYVILQAARSFVSMVNNVCLINGAEIYTMFVAVLFAHDVPPVRAIFQHDISYGGGGSFLYCIASSLFIRTIGDTFIALRITSCLIIILLGIVIWIFCARWLTKRVGALMLLFLLIPSKVVSGMYIVGEGRHFDANIFFVVQLLLFIEAVKKKSIALYLLLAVVLGFAVYYYPGNIFTAGVTLCALTIVSIVHRKARITHIVGIIMLLLSVYFAGRYLHTGMGGVRALLDVCFNSPKTLTLPDANLAKSLVVAILNTVGVFFAHGNFMSTTFDVQKLLGVSIGSGTIATLFAIIVVAMSYVWLLFSVQKSTKNVFCKGGRKNDKDFSTLLINYYLVFYVALFYLLYACNPMGVDNHKYLMFMYAPWLLIISQALARLYTKNKLAVIICVSCLLFFNQINLFREISSFDLNNIHKHSTYYYQEKCTMEMLDGQSDRMLIKMYETFPQCAAYTVGRYLYYSHNVKLLSMLSGDREKQHLCYQGFAAAYTEKEEEGYDVDLILNELSEESLDAWYRGVGNGVMYSLSNHGINFSNFITARSERYAAKIQDSAEKVPFRFKRQFYYGMGEGIARLYVQPYQPKLQYVKSAEDAIAQYARDYSIAEYADAMIEGFNRNIVWEKYR